MLRQFRLLTYMFVLGLYASPSSAQIFTIKVTDYDGADSYPGLKAVIDDAVLSAQNDVNKDFPSGAPDRLMEGMANSSVFAGKGVGTDYASNMSVFLIGAGVGVGADLAKPKGTDSDLSGVGVAPGVIVGFNLGFMDSKTFLGMDTDRLNLYFNFMSYKLKQEIADDEKPSQISVNMLSFGTHLRYNWVRPRGNKLFGWGGVKFNVGFEYNKTKFDFNTKLKEDVSESGPSSETISGTVSGNPAASILASTTSIPIAFSTDIQLLYFISLYTGAGVDVNFGQAKGSGDLNGQESTLNCTGGTLCSTPRSIKVQPKANIDTSASVAPISYRAFAGFQFNLPWTRIYVQVDKSLSNDLIGATAGLRFAF